MEFLLKYQFQIMLVLQGICWVIALLTAYSKNISKLKKSAMICLELSSALLLISNMLFLSYNGNPSSMGWWCVRISKFSYCLFTLLVLDSYNLYLVSLYKEKKEKPNTLLRVVEIVFTLGLVVLIVAHFTGYYYQFDENNFYMRTRGRVVSYAFPLLILLIQLVCIFMGIKKIDRRILILIFSFTLAPIVATIIQFNFQGLYLADMTTVGMVIVLFIFTIQDSNVAVEKAHKLEIELLERYQKELEQTVDERTRELRIANKKAENLLLNILPKEIAMELAEHPGKTISKRYPNATVLFTDIVGFTRMSSKMTAEQTVLMLNKMTTLFDQRAEREGIEKIKTIGDAYMAACGLNELSENDGAKKICRFAKGLLQDVESFNKAYKCKVKIRIGINTGALVAGVIGKTKFIYDIWGDTVNVASRMESTGEPMKIHVSEETYNQTKDSFSYSEALQVEVKGKGLMNCRFLM